MNDRQEKLATLVLALCPVLLVCTSVINSIVMSLFFISLLILSTGTISLFRNHLSPQCALFGILLVNASWTGCLEMLFKVFFYELSSELGIYLPLLAMNSALLLALQDTALLHSPMVSLRTNLRQGVFIVLVVCLVGLTRELLGNASLFENTEYLHFAGPEKIELPFAGLEILQSPVAVFLLLGLGYPLVRKLYESIGIRRA